MPDLTQPNTSDAQAIADLVLKHAGAQIATSAPIDGVATLALLPTGMKVEDLGPMVEKTRLQPIRRKGTAKLGSIQSFIDHANRFKDLDSVVFAEPDQLTTPPKPRLLSVLDYHRAGGEGAPRWNVHRGLYEFPLSEEWRAWSAVDGKTLDQNAFAEFIEDRIGDVLPSPDAIDPADNLARIMREFATTFATPAKLMELSRGLKIHEVSQVANVVNLSTGEGQISWTAEHQDAQGQPMKVPGAFLIAVPVFFAGAAYRIPVRLRYRKSGPSIKWALLLYRPEITFRHAFDEAVELVSEKTKLPVLHGNPEA
jgi:uncharacterized protein YfdQ (DUF2303 family)